MTKSQVRRNLGKPLVEGVPPNTPPSIAIPDPEDARDDFFSGIFAWVDYGDKDKVTSITFDLASFHEKFKGDQHIILAYRGNVYRLNGTLTQKEFLSMIKDKIDLKSNVRIEYNSLVLRGTGTSLLFAGKNGGLSSISVIWSINQ